MTSIVIDVSQTFDVIQDNITALHQRLDGDLTPLMKAIGSVLESSTRQRFADKKAPNGTSWANLLPQTIAAKAKKNKSVSKGGISVSRGLLVESGDLFKSISFQASKDKVAVGTSELYGVYHQFGTKNMVARPFLGISSDDEQTINELIYDYLDGNL